MSDSEISGRLIGLVAVGFVLLVGLQIWLHQADQAEPRQDEPMFSPTKIEETGQEIDIGGEGDSSSGPPSSVDDLTRRKIRKLRNGDVSDRRSAALRLTFRPHPAAEGALLDGLQDPDRQVAEQCSQALLKLWRISGSAVANQRLELAFGAYERGRWDAALRHLHDICKLDPDISEVYRLKAKIWLRRNKPEKALKNATKAISLQENHFRARFLMARSYLQQGKEEEARRELNRVLSIYPYFEEAAQLQKKLNSEGQNSAQEG